MLRLKEYEDLMKMENKKNWKRKIQKRRVFSSIFGQTRNRGKGTNKK